MIPVTCIIRLKSKYCDKKIDEDYLEFHLWCLVDAGNSDSGTELWEGQDRTRA